MFGLFLSAGVQKHNYYRLTRSFDNILEQWQLFYLTCITSLWFQYHSLFAYSNLVPVILLAFNLCFFLSQKETQRISQATSLSNTPPMATRAKENARHKSKSRPTTKTPSSSSDGTATSKQEKPVPNYLKPTISSFKNSARQHTECPSFTNKKPREKAQVLSQFLSPQDKTNNPPASKPSISPKSWEKTTTTTRPVKNDKAQAPTTSSKSTCKAAHVMPKKSTKSPTLKEKEKERSGPSGSEESKRQPNKSHNTKEETLPSTEPTIINSAAPADDHSPSANNETSSPDQDGKLKTPKGSPTAYNDVIEETANRLAENTTKVKALAGAFETVTSLQSPKGGSPQKSPNKNDQYIISLHKSKSQPSPKSEVEIGQSSQQDQEEKVNVKGELVGEVI